MFHLFCRAVSMTHRPSLADPASVLLPSKSLSFAYLSRTILHPRCTTLGQWKVVERGAKPDILVLALQPTGLMVVVFSC